MNRPDVSERAFVFNLVWTEGAFEYLGLFTESVLAHSDARVRFVANGCRPDEVEAMDRYASQRPDRVEEVMVVSEHETLRHGDALDEVHERRDDGPYFCLLDPDILATGPFVSDFAASLDGVAAITAGRELWSDDNVLPADHPGLNGEYFFRADGYLYGSPHFAIYDAPALAETIQRWGIGFGEGGSGLDDETHRRLRDAGHGYMLYDTGKLVNILLQEDGHALDHREHEHLVHVGGMLHFLWAPRVTDSDGSTTPDWANWRGMTARHAVAKHAADVLRARLAGEASPPIPDAADIGDELRPKLRRAAQAMDALVASHGDDWVRIAGDGPGPARAARSSYNAMRRPAPARPRRTPG